jgi:hypothetical protein
MISTDSIIESLRADLPTVFTRAKAEELLGGIISAGSLANADSAGEGPEGLFYMGRKAAYRKEAFLEWLRPRLVQGKMKRVPRANGATR